MSDEELDEQLIPRRLPPDLVNRLVGESNRHRELPQRLQPQHKGGTAWQTMAPLLHHHLGGTDEWQLRRWEAVHAARAYPSANVGREAVLAREPAALKCTHRRREARADVILPAPREVSKTMTVGWS